MAAPADGNLALLSERRPSGGTGGATRRNPNGMAGDAAHRAGRVVELEHHRSQFHTPALLPIGGDEPVVFCRPQCSAGRSADAVARPSPGASRRQRMAIACFRTPGGRDSARAWPLVRTDMVRTALFPVGLPSWISGGAGVVRHTGALGTRHGAAYQPLRAHLQFLVLQRWISRRAPRRSCDSLVTAAAFQPNGRGY